mmetsp:Transcript_29711/g.98461  ORF Transcript_29711/g.98461 Transcript_29711/m.98461 type:complete len:200 (+) Transcript_29711:1333-1932(+)
MYPQWREPLSVRPSMLECTKIDEVGDAVAHCLAAGRFQETGANGLCATCARFTSEKQTRGMDPQHKLLQRHPPDLCRRPVAQQPVMRVLRDKMHACAWCDSTCPSPALPSARARHKNVLQTRQAPCTVVAQLLDTRSVHHHPNIVDGDACLCNVGGQYYLQVLGARLPANLLAALVCLCVLCQCESHTYMNSLARQSQG